MSFDFNKAIQTITTIKSVYSAVGPMIHDVVVQVEAAMPVGGTGSAKLAEAKSILFTVASVAGVIEADFITAWPVINAVITAIINLYNLGNGWTAALAGVSSLVGAVTANTVPLTTLPSMQTPLSAPVNS